MLSDRILQTIKFFDLQEYPLTSFELWRFLVTDIQALRADLDENFELTKVDDVKPVPVHFDTLLAALDSLLKEGKVVGKNGLYCLPEKKLLISKRLVNYRFGIKRERRIRRFLWFTKFLPFVRGIGIAGSQAMGLERASSDIDLLVKTDENYLWFARIFLSAYFQIFGVRRHGQKIANRFCLNHYFTHSKIETSKNFYTALEYAKLRNLIYPQSLYEFQKQNLNWIRMFFPNVDIMSGTWMKPSAIQRIVEGLLNHKLGKKLNDWLGTIQLARIKQDKYIFVRNDELSFHPHSKQEALLQSFLTQK